MALSAEYCLARAEEAANEAEASSLENVRLRAQRSESVWRDMADRAQRIEQGREASRIERDRRRREEDALDWQGPSAPDA